MAYSERIKSVVQKEKMSPERKEALFEFLHVCRECHVPFEEKHQLMMDGSFLADEEKTAYLKKITEYVRNTYSKISVEQFLTEVNESCDWDELRHYDDLYWKNMQELLHDAIRLSAINVIELVAPHVLFGNEKILGEYCALAQNDEVRCALKKSFIRRHDDDYEQYPFSWLWNKQVYNHRESYGEVKLISLAEEVQEKLWQAFLNKYASGSELLFYEHMTALYAEDRKYTHVKYDREIASHRLRDMGYRVIHNGFEKMPLPEYWIMKGTTGNLDADMYYGAVCMEAMMKAVGWDVQQEMISNEYGVTGYAYLKEIPDVEEKISIEDRVLNLFHFAFNGKIKWQEVSMLMSENCHYYSDGSKRDIATRDEIIAFCESMDKKLIEPEQKYHAHYARLRNPICDPKLLGHKVGERILAVWQGELEEHYSGLVFFHLNEDNLVDDIYLCQDNRYRFRTFIPLPEEDLLEEKRE